MAPRHVPKLEGEARRKACGKACPGTHKKLHPTGLRFGQRCTKNALAFRANRLFEKRGWRPEPLRPRSIAAAGQLLQQLSAAFPQAADRKSTRLNSSHRCISYAVFC